MKNSKSLNDLEKTVLREFCVNQRIEVKNLDNILDDIIVEGRNYSAVGFLTQVKRPNFLKLMANDESFTGGKIGAFLNKERIDTGYVIYIKDGIFDAIEGYTYGDIWPPKIEKIETFLI